MGKPICVVKFDATNQPQDIILELNQILRERMPDYHVFVIPNYYIGEPIDQMEFNVFYEKDFTEIQYAELRKLIEDSIKPTTTRL